MYETTACSGRIIDKNGNTKAHVCVRVCNSCQSPTKLVKPEALIMADLSFQLSD